MGSNPGRLSIRGAGPGLDIDCKRSGGAPRATLCALVELVRNAVTIAGGRCRISIRARRANSSPHQLYSVYPPGILVQVQ